MNKRKIVVLAVIMFVFVFIGIAFACTSFRVQTKDGGIVIGRSMEWGIPENSQVMIVPRGMRLETLKDDGTTLRSWTGKYGFVGMNAYGIDIATDGLNEAGLSVGVLNFPGFAGYHKLDEANASQAVSNLHFVNWLLSNYATVEEVKAALKDVVVYNLLMQNVGSMQVHWVIYDAKGGSIVVEPIDGKLKIYDNPIGVMTNSPTFDWHLTNLRNYVNLTNLNIDSLKLGPITVEPLGQGTGLLGLPGDYTPPSRFVKTVALVWSAVQPENAAEGVNLAFHILNSVDIPTGACADKIDGKLYYDRTQWATVRDLLNGVYYYRTYGDQTIRKVDTKALDLTGKTIRHIPVPTELQSVDMTGQVK